MKEDAIIDEKFQYEEEKRHDDPERQVALAEEDDSPIEEVRVTVSNTDDPQQPYNTFRMWFLGLLFTAIISFVNQFFYLRQTTLTLNYAIVALIALPCGHFLARVLPTRQVDLFGYKFSLNPGPFSIKEHVLIGTMAACNTSTAYAVDIVLIQKLFYHEEKSFVAGLFLVLTTQIAGFSMAGAIRRFLVRPAHMVWPATLVTASLFRSLHAEADQDNQGRMSRMKYFAIVCAGSFIYYWFPGLIFPTIGYISWICWINPDNIILAQLTGSNGLGIGTIALDWSAASYYVGPLVTPWFAQVNILVGFVLVTYIMVPWAYYSNLWNSQNFPIITATLFMENGTEYNVTKVLDDKGVLVESLYTNYSPLRMDSFFALTYGVGFAGLTSTLVHVALYHGREIIARWKSARDENEDVHSRLMRAYPEVPDWWYGLLFVITFSLSMVTVEVWDYMPWWALLLAFAIAAVFVLPVGIVQAITNQTPGLNIITEYAIGYLLPGHAIANVTFKTYGYIVNIQALNFVSDLKLGHYMKIPPRVMFMAQLISAIMSCIINLGTATWLVNTRPNVCTKEGFPFTCRNTKTFYSASVIWGAIGPERVFGHKDKAIYSPVQWGFLAGVLLPLIFWYASKRFPTVSWLKSVHWPVLLAATSNMPPALPYMYSNGLFIGFIFAFLLRRYRYDWWSRYNYLTSAALDAGVAVAGLMIFFAIQSWNGAFPFWWGNPDDKNPDANAGALDHCALGGAPYIGSN
ncbi:MAG: OPT family small oligopeptide transporter [Linnemannia elongata]|nr:MAG: OPT family small oligopeptide transporter [Linnemannia elongata]